MQPPPTCSKSGALLPFRVGFTAAAASAAAATSAAAAVAAASSSSCDRDLVLLNARGGVGSLLFNVSTTAGSGTLLSTLPRPLPTAGVTPNSDARCESSSCCACGVISPLALLRGVVEKRAERCEAASFASMVTGVGALAVVGRVGGARLLDAPTADWRLSSSAADAAAAAAELAAALDAAVALPVA